MDFTGNLQIQGSASEDYCMFYLQQCHLTIVIPRKINGQFLVFYFYCSKQMKKKNNNKVNKRKRRERLNIFHTRT